MTSRLMPWIIAVVALAIGAAGYHLGQGWSGQEKTPPGGFEVLKLRLADAEGQPQAMQQWDGKVLVVNYWATWCPPCLEEMPGFSRLHQKYSSNGVQFVGIGIDIPDKIRHFRDSTKISYPLLVGGMDAASTSVELGNKHQALPFTAIFDAQRKLISVKLGRWQEADLERELQALLRP